MTRVSSRHPARRANTSVRPYKTIVFAVGVVRLFCQTTMLRPYNPFLKTFENLQLDRLSELKGLDFQILALLAGFDTLRHQNKPF
jgi:hypothetical protein